MLQGRSVHQALKYGYSEKLETHKTPKAEQVLEVFASHFGLELENEPPEWKKEETPEKLLDEGVALVKLYVAERMPTIQPVMVEQQFEAQFANMPFGLTGYIDLVEKGDVVVDHKVTGKSPNIEDVQTDQQLSTYSIGYKTLTGRRPKRMRFDYLVRGKNPKIVPIETKRSATDEKRFLANVALIRHGIEHDVFYCMHPGGSWVCRKDWCGYEARGYHAELYKLGVRRFIDKYAGRDVDFKEYDSAE